jgi:alpha 1,2-mannosyltransferase
MMMNPAIVYLAQNTHTDPLWGRRSRRAMLEKSLDLLFKNYNDKFRHPVIIFHEGDFKPKDQEEVIKGRDLIQFREIHFEIPSFLRKDEIPEKWSGIYTMGYRHMMRFYAIMIYDTLDELGYDYFMRLDDDSFIHSPIEYNLFEFMEKNGYEYGYRVDTHEDKCYLLGFSETILGYVKSKQIKPTFLYQHLELPSIKSILKNYIKSALEKLYPDKQYTFEQISEYDRWGYYDNFYITKISFWKRPEVQSFLHYLDRVGGGYKYRWGDHLQQSAAIQIFMPKDKLHKFTDWTYEHATFDRNGILGTGGIFDKAGGGPSELSKKYMKLYGKIHSENTR